MTNRRRIILIVVSVALGSAASLMIIQQRSGNLTRENYIQVMINFFFAVVIVIGIAVLLRKNKDPK